MQVNGGNNCMGESVYLEPAGLALIRKDQLKHLGFCPALPLRVLLSFELL